MPSNWKQALGLRAAGVYYAWLLLLSVLAAVAAARGLPAYLSPTNLGNILYQSSLVALMGVAMTVVLITGAFDLSVASVAALAAAVLVGLAGPMGPVAAAGCALATALAVGLFNGLAVEWAGLNPFIVTLASLTAVRGLVLIVTDGRSLMVESPAALARLLAFESARLPAFAAACVAGVALLAFGAWRRRALAAGWGAGLLLVAMLAGRGWALPTPVVVMLSVTGLTWAVLTLTVVGRRLQAVGGNAEAARLAGIDVHAYRVGAFLYSSLAAGLAGVLFGSRLGSLNPTALQGTELTVIAAAILGGTSLLGGSGSVVKTVVGALVLFTLTNGFNILDLGANYQGVIEGAVIILAAAIYSVGARRRSGEA